MKTIQSLVVVFFTAIFSSCYPAPAGQRPMGNYGYPPQAYPQQGPQQGSPRYGPVQQGGQRRLDSVTVRRVHFQANVAKAHAGRRQEVSDYASAYFERTHGKIITDRQLSEHFGFECHVRQVGPIKSVKVRPDEVPANIRAKFQ